MFFVKFLTKKYYFIYIILIFCYILAMGKVYLIANEEWTQFKIGISTKELDKRINALKTGNGSEISLVKSFDTAHHRKVEKWMHNKHNSKRLVGEWFALNDDDIVNFISDCQKAHDTFQCLIDSGNPFI